ncbi:hypothetical protein [Roseococcus sp. YIM B11640]
METALRRFAASEAGALAALALRSVVVIAATLGLAALAGLSPG